ncbi:hypothetical protein GGE65_007274 [Skermanella aerolata]|uniref:hypothetical protein n=1 Tax=Skermanella aerolata TaxID=393310 RepID=UPI003D24151A
MTPLRMTYREIANGLDAQPGSALAYLMKNGKLVKNEFHCGDVLGNAPKRGKGGSFSFNIDTLLGDDFAAAGDGYKGVLPVYIANHGGDYWAARETALQFLGLPQEERPQPRIGRHSRGQKSGEPWSQIFPPPDIPPDFQSLVWRDHSHNGTWPYKSADGKILFYVVRFEETVINPEAGEPMVVKATPVVSYGHFPDGRRHWRTKGAGLNILYGLDQLAQRPGVPVLVVEGEKAATAAAKLFPDWVVVCWKGGTGNVGRIDFRPLRGRIVYFLADADAVGVEAMRKAQHRANRAGAVWSNLVVPPQACWDQKSGWDLADPMPAGWTVDQIRDLLATTTPTTEYTTASWTGRGLRPYYDAPMMTPRQARRMQRATINSFVSGEVKLVQSLEKARRLAQQENDRLEEEAGRSLTPAEKAKITKSAKRSVAQEFGMESLRNGRRILVVGSQGTGKSSDALQALARVGIPWLRVVFSLPTVDKCWEALDQYNKYRRRNSLPGYVVLGRGAYAERPDAEGRRKSETRVCPRHELFNRAASMRLSPRRNLCPTCPLAKTCWSLKQEAELQEMRGGVFFMAREYVFLQLPVRGVHMLIGDENLTTVAASKPLYLNPNKILEMAKWEGFDLDEVKLVEAELICVHQAVTGHPEAILAHLRTCKVTPSSLLKVASLLDREFDAAAEAQVKLDGNKSDEDLKAQLDQLQELEFGAVARLCRQLALELRQPRDQANTVCVRRPTDKATGREQIQVAVFHLKAPRIARETPVLLLDGTGSEWLNRKVFGKSLEVVRVPIDRSARVVGTIGERVVERVVERDGQRVTERNIVLRDFSRQSLTGLDRQGNEISPAKTAEATILRCEVAEIAKSLAPVFVCATLKATTMLESDFTATGTDIAIGHFGDVRGKNKWQHYPSALLIGREEVTPWALEDLTRPFLADDPEPLIPLVNDAGVSCYVQQTRGRRMRDGTVVPVVVNVHADVRCQEVHEQIREAELLQAIDRVRAIYNRRLLVLLNNMCLDVTYDAVVSWAELKSGGNDLDRAFAKHGQTVWLTNPGELYRCHRDLWNSKDGAKKTIDRTGGDSFPRVLLEALKEGPDKNLLGNCPPLCIRYQLSGEGQQPCTAWVAAHPSEARATLERVVGTLANYEIDWASNVSAAVVPQIPPPLRGDEVDDMEMEEAAEHAHRSEPDLGRVADAAEPAAEHVLLPLQATASTMPAPQAVAPTATHLADNDVLDQEEPGAVEPDYEEYMVQQHQTIYPPLRNAWNKLHQVGSDAIKIKSEHAKINVGYGRKAKSEGLEHELQ